MAKFDVKLTGQLSESRQISLQDVWIFSVVSVLLSVVVIFLLPGYAGAVLIVFFPTLAAIALIALRSGRNQIRPRLFSARAWHLTVKWFVISLAVALALRLGVSLLGLFLVPDYQWQPGSFSPLLLMTFLFAAGEEIGWRGFALPTMLAHGYRPLTAALILGALWALLHLPLVLPGMLSAGTPMPAQFLIVLTLSIILTWAYLGGGNSLSPAVLLHGGQNTFVILNSGLDPVASGWLMAAVYGTVALLIIVLTRGKLGFSEA